MVAESPSRSTSCFSFSRCDSRLPFNETTYRSVGLYSTSEDFDYPEYLRTTGKVQIIAFMLIIIAKRYPCPSLIELGFTNMIFHQPTIQRSSVQLRCINSSHRSLSRIFQEISQYSRAGKAWSRNGSSLGTPWFVILHFAKPYRGFCTSGSRVWGCWRMPQRLIVLLPISLQSLRRRGVSNSMVLEQAAVRWVWLVFWLLVKRNGAPQYIKTFRTKRFIGARCLVLLGNSPTMALFSPPLALWQVSNAATFVRIETWVHVRWIPLWWRQR